MVRLRVGVVGLGKIAQVQHLPALRELDEFELVGVCDLSPTVARRVAARYGLDSRSVYDDHRDLLAGPVDAVVVTNHYHTPIVLDALAARKHVFVEKPLCWNVDEGRAIIDALGEAGTVLQVGYMKRYDPAVELFAESLHTVGACHLVRIHNFAGGRHRHERLVHVEKPEDLDEARRAEELASIEEAIGHAFPDGDQRRASAYRTLIQLAIHDLNLQRALFGDPVFDEGVAIEAADRPPAYLARFTHADGTRSTWEVVADFASARDWDEELVVFGEHGRLGLRFSSPFVPYSATSVFGATATAAGLVETRTMPSRESAFVRQLGHFHRAVTESVPVRTPAAEAVADIELITDIVRRARFE